MRTAWLSAILLVSGAVPVSLAADPVPESAAVRVILGRPDTPGSRYASGTVIHSTADKAIILTCDHTFTTELAQAPLVVDTYQWQRGDNRFVYAQRYNAQLIDNTHQYDLALLSITTDHKLPAARIAPRHWRPQVGMGLHTVGCDDGADPTFWQTKIVEVNHVGQLGNGNLFAGILCKKAPKQGRSGGGLFTTDKYLVGVSCFALCNCNQGQQHAREEHECVRGAGLYAPQQSIYRFLDKNGLSAVYQPAQSQPAQPQSPQRHLLLGN